MPGFLEVFGYYSEDLGKWNIDVHLPHTGRPVAWVGNTNTHSTANRPTTDLFTDDNRHIHILAHGRALQRQIRPKTWTVGSHDFELCGHEHPVGHNKQSCSVCGETYPR